MIMGVSAAAYGAGLFHLMTHAFFKALLFMGAGSVIGAMAGIQDMNKMGGFKKAMPFTFITFVCGALALAGFPLTSGFFSKDEILSFTINRGGGFVVLGILGYIAAFMTAFYAFRIVFRTFYGDAVPEAKELEGGHIAHGPPVNPANMEEEDTDIGFPGPEHHIAERELPMKVAMGTLAFLALTAGVLGIPGVTDVVDKFLEPTFEDSRYVHDTPGLGMEYALMACGAIIAVSGIYLAYYVYRRRPGTAARMQERFAGLHRVLVHKYYFDELYDAVFVRPMTTAGKIGRTVVEKDFVQGTIVGGTVGIVRLGTSLARGLQTGLLRAYALLLIFGVAALALYFLLQSS
jgi:NADH-quinone oxidoreductase subunit L